MKKALITGANGFIGSLLVSELLNNGVNVIAADLPGQNNRISPQARFVDFDMHDFGTLKNKVPDKDIDTMYHMAWLGSSGAARGDYTLQLDNVKCTCDAVMAASEMNIKRFVGAGTLKQMDCLSYVGRDFSTPDSISCYGTAKIAAQYMSKAMANEKGIEHVWCLISTTYGAGDSTMNFVNFASSKMLLGEHVGFTDGEQNCDFVYISDTIHGIYLCGESGKPNCSYYIGSGKARKLKEYIQAIRSAINPEASICLGEIPFKGESLPLETYSCKKIMADTGYSAEVDFESGIVKTVEWLKKRMEESKNA